MATMQKERLRPLSLAEQHELRTITKASFARVGSRSGSGIDPAWAAF